MTTTATSTTPTTDAGSLPVVPHWIDGAEAPSTPGRTAPVYDPALGVATKNVALADQSEIDHAVASAAAASSTGTPASDASSAEDSFDAIPPVPRWLPRPATTPSRSEGAPTSGMKRALLFPLRRGSPS